MRLLEKREIDQKRADQERARNNEGAKLAKKVEKVRELAAETKIAYEAYRERALAAIQAELAPLYEQRDILVSDIREKKAEWKKLFDPLDIQFARYVKTERESIEAEQARQALENNRINKVSQEQEEERLILSNQAKQNERQRLDAAKASKEAEAALKRSTSVLVEAQGKASSIIASAQQQALASQKQAERSALQAQDVQNRSNALDMREKSLEDREMAVIIKELRQYSPIQPIGNYSPVSKKKKL